MGVRSRFDVLVAAIVLTAAACGSGGTTDGASGDLDAPKTASTVSNAAACENKTLTSPEVGVSENEITVTALADVNNPIRPALFEGAWNGVKAWAEYMNSIGGLACRTVVVKTVDSKLSGEEVKNAVQAACSDSVAMVGTAALFLQDVKGLETCKDKEGNATGLPDMATTQPEPAHQCSRVSFAPLPTGSLCPYKGSGVRDYLMPRGSYDYYFAQNPNLDLHGVFVIPKDLPSAISAATPVIRAQNKVGITNDAEFGISGLATQPEYTQVVQAMKAHKSNYVSSMMDYAGNLLMRKEAEAQGLDDQIKIWDCLIQCYDKRLISEGGSAVEGQYVWLTSLPIEDGAGVNPVLDAFIKYDKKPDAFGLQAFAAGMAFAQAVEQAMTANNGDPNAITRANILTAFRGMHDFDAGGLIPKTDIAAKKSPGCYVGMQVKNGNFVRVFPAEKGTFDCAKKGLLAMKIDPLKEYKG